MALAVFLFSKGAAMKITISMRRQIKIDFSDSTLNILEKYTHFSERETPSFKSNWEPTSGALAYLLAPPPWERVFFTCIRFSAKLTF